VKTTAERRKEEADMGPASSLDGQTLHWFAPVTVTPGTDSYWAAAPS
jgi:hypothetical protein